MALYGGVPGMCPEGDVLQVTVWFVVSSKLSHRKHNRKRSCWNVGHMLMDSLCYISMFAHWLESPNHARIK